MNLTQECKFRVPNLRKIFDLLHIKVQFAQFKGYLSGVCKDLKFLLAGIEF